MCQHFLGYYGTKKFFSFSFICASTGPAMSFFRLVRHPVGLVKFREQLSQLQNHEQHVILCFASNQMRWCFLSCPGVCVRTVVSLGIGSIFSLVGIFFKFCLLETSCFPRPGATSLLPTGGSFSDISHVLLVWSFSLNADPDLALNYDADVFCSLLESCRSYTCLFYGPLLNCVRCWKVVSFIYLLGKFLYCLLSVVSRYDIQCNF